MKIEFDPAKNSANKDKHGVSLETAAEFDWDTAVIFEDARRAYGETRQTAFGFIGNRLHVLVFTMRNDHCRVISLRKTNKRETQRYVNATG